LAELVQAEGARTAGRPGAAASAWGLHRNAIVWAAAFPVVWLWALVVVFPILPDFAAVLGAAILAFLVPGFILLLLTRRTWTGSEALALSFALGLSQAAVVSLPALLIHLQLAYVVIPHVLLTTVLIYIASKTSRARIEVSRAELGLLAGVLVAATVAATFLTGDLWRSQDNWRALAYTASYARGESINAEDPNLGEGLPVQARVLFRVQSVDAALLADFGDADVVDVTMDHFAGVSSMLSFFAVFALAVRFGGSQRAGIFAVIIFALFALVDIYYFQSYGRGVFMRAGEDKMLASFNLFPGLVLFALTMRPRMFDSALLVLLAIGLTLMHPFGIAFVGFAMAPFLVAAVLDRTPEKIAVARAGVAALAVCSLFAIFQRFIANDTGVFLFGEEQTNVRDFWVNLPWGMIIMDPRSQTHPLLWVAIAAGLFLPFLLKDTRLRLVALFLSVGIAASLFFPPTATLIGKLATPGLLWRFLLIIPAASILGAALALMSRWQLSAAALIVIGIATIGANEALVSADYYLGDETGEGLALFDGIERALEEDEPRTYALRGQDVRDFVRDLDSAIEGEGVVLTPTYTGLGGRSVLFDYAIPVYSDDLKAYTKGPRFRSLSEPWEEGEIYESLVQRGRDGVTKRSAFGAMFYAERFPPMVPYEALFEQKPITHVLLPVSSYYLIYRLDRDPFFERVGVLQDGNYVLFEVTVDDN
jgi:hypothetical protein